MASASLNEVDLLIFDGQFDLSNLSSTRLLVASFHVATLIKYLSFLRPEPVFQEWRQCERSQVCFS